MNLNQLEYFVEAVKTESYAEAAKKLYVTPQAVSKSLKELEKELGVPLFVKTGKVIRPTDYALRLLEPATKTLAGASAIRDFATHSQAATRELTR